MGEQDPMTIEWAFERGAFERGADLEGEGRIA